MTAARRYGFAAVVFGALIALSLPLYLTRGSSCVGIPDCGVGIHSPEGLLGAYALAHPHWLEVYWAAASVVACGAVFLRYRRAGKAGRAVPALAIGVLLAGATIVLTADDWPGFRSPSAVLESARLVVFNGGTPLLISAVVLVVLALVERSLWLLALSVGYGAVAYLFTTYDAFYLLQLNGLDDPSGIRQLVNIAVPAGLLIVVGLLLVALGGSRRQ